MRNAIVAVVCIILIVSIVLFSISTDTIGVDINLEEQDTIGEAYSSLFKKSWNGEVEEYPTDMVGEE